MSEREPAPIGALFDALAADYEPMRQELGWDPFPHVWCAFGDGRLDDLDLLDVGCGPGEVAARLAERGARVCGVDASMEMCARAAERLPGLPFLPADLGDGLPFGDGTFDGVIALGCMEYVVDVEAACDELVRVLRPGGTALFVIELCGPQCPGGEAEQVWFLDDWIRHRRPLEAVTAWAASNLADARVEVVPGYLLEETGERVVYARVLGHRPSP